MGEYAWTLKTVCVGRSRGNFVFYMGIGGAVTCVNEKRKSRGVADGFAGPWDYKKRTT